MANTVKDREAALKAAAHEAGYEVVKTADGKFSVYHHTYGYIGNTHMDLATAEKAVAANRG